MKNRGLRAHEPPAIGRRRRIGKAVNAEGGGGREGDSASGAKQQRVTPHAVSCTGFLIKDSHGRRLPITRCVHSHSLRD